MILIGGSLLWLGSESLVFGSKNLAELAGIPNELIGFTIIAIGTSLPELAASIALIKKDETPMLLGNIIGSNLFNIGLVGGIAGILGPIVGESPHPWLDHLTMILFTINSYIMDERKASHTKAWNFPASSVHCDICNHMDANS